MFRALALSIGQLGDPAILRVLAKSLAVTLGLFVLLGIGVWWGARAATDGWLASVFALFVTVLALWLLFRAVAIGVIGVFAMRWSKRSRRGIIRRRWRARGRCRSGAARRWGCDQGAA